MAVDLIKKILIKDVPKRMGFGADGYKNLHSHPFFKQIDWENEIYHPIDLIINISKQSNLSSSCILFMIQQ